MLKKTQLKFREKFFSSIHLNNLVYNTCWEDPSVDRKLLNIDEQSTILMITSAGCNALDYLLDNPKSISCVDMNPRQNALLDLKQSLFENSDHNTLYKFFGEGQKKNVEKYYKRNLRESLKYESRKFWDKKISFFGKNKKTFYYHGTSGQFASIFRKFADTQPKLRDAIELLFESKNLDEQAKHFVQLDKIFSNLFLKWFLNRQFTLALLGIPEDQYVLIKNDFPSGIQGYLKEKFRHIFTQLPTSDNYFWRVYFYGYYSKKCSPNYLKKTNFDFLKDNQNKITTHTNTITNFLTENPNEYSHYILLDHLDWLAVNNPEALKEEWKQIFNNSKSGTKVLFRSASFNREFLPKYVKDKLIFDDDSVALNNPFDRVGTYASTHLGIIK